jgi:acyl-CoA reductase-like NAD-dependent aldehyde dehydrogenase
MTAGAKVSEVLIEGVWRPAVSGAELVVHNPATLKPVAAAPFCDAQDVVLSMAAARRALESWRACPSEVRTALLVAIGCELSACAPAIAELQALESGQAYRECLAGVLAAAKCFTQLSDQDRNSAWRPVRRRLQCCALRGAQAAYLWVFSTCSSQAATP